MKKIIICFVLILNVLFGNWSNSVYAQTYYTNKGEGIFSISAPAKTINAKTQKVSIEIDINAAKLQLTVPVGSFQFTNNFVSDSLNMVIQERFNNYYMESDKYPDVTYKATILNNSSISYDRDGSYPIHTRGILRIHGVGHEVSADGLVEVRGSSIIVSAKIVVQPARYDIRIPAYIGNMYFREVFIDCKADLQKQGVQ